MAWFHPLCALAAALAAPIFMVMIRHDVRLARLRALFEFDQLFNMSGAHADEADAAARTERPSEASSQSRGATPTYEFVRARYTSDIVFPDFPDDWVRKFDLSKREFRRFVRSLHWWKIGSSWALLLSCTPLMVMVALGMLALLNSAPESGAANAIAQFPAPLLVTGAASTAGAQTMLAHNATMVAEAAFLGAYVFTLLLFLRALATFDLSPLTVLRGTIYFVVGVLGAVLMYLAFPDVPAQTIDAVASVGDRIAAAAPLRPPPSAAPAKPSSGPTAAAPGGPGGPGDPPPPRRRGSGPDGGSPPDRPREPKPLPPIWLAMAFLMGFIPDLAFNALISGVQRFLRIKTTDDRLSNANKSTPLDIIDGIDVLTRFRLQESNVFEVQNLAVANPVMLFVETPYGIYQVIDWVAQAQLCVAVGPERFLEFQRRGIRTIFDLERTVLSVFSTSQLRRYVAGVLLASIPSLPDSVAVKGFASLPTQGGPAAALPSRGGLDAFAQFADGLFAASAMSSDGVNPSPDPDETIKHLVRTMADDLHVCRLRQVWQQIMSKIDGVPSSHRNSDRLWDTGWPPPLPPGMQAPVY